MVKKNILALFFVLVLPLLTLILSGPVIAVCQFSSTEPITIQTDCYDGESCDSYGLVSISANFNSDCIDNDGSKRLVINFTNSTFPNECFTNKINFGSVGEDWVFSNILTSGQIVNIPGIQIRDLYIPNYISGAKHAGNCSQLYYPGVYFNASVGAYLYDVALPGQPWQLIASKTSNIIVNSGEGFYAYEGVCGNSKIEFKDFLNPSYPVWPNWKEYCDCGMDQICNSAETSLNCNSFDLRGSGNLECYVDGGRPNGCIGYNLNNCLCNFSSVYIKTNCGTNNICETGETVDFIFNLSGGIEDDSGNFDYSSICYNPEVTFVLEDSGSTCSINLAIENVDPYYIPEESFSMLPYTYELFGGYPEGFKDLSGNHYDLAKSSTVYTWNVNPGACDDKIVRITSAKLYKFTGTNFANFVTDAEAKLGEINFGAATSCDLTDAYWTSENELPLGNSADVCFAEDNMYLKVEGSNCDGEQIKFEIKDDGDNPIYDVTSVYPDTSIDLGDLGQSPGTLLYFKAYLVSDPSNFVLSPYISLEDCSGNSCEANGKECVAFSSCSSERINNLYTCPVGEVCCDDGGDDGDDGGHSSSICSLHGGTCCSSCQGTPLIYGCGGTGAVCCRVCRDGNVFVTRTKCVDDDGDGIGTYNETVRKYDSGGDLESITTQTKDCVVTDENVSFFTILSAVIVLTLLGVYYFYKEKKR